MVDIPKTGLKSIGGGNRCFAMVSIVF